MVQPAGPGRLDQQTGQVKPDHQDLGQLFGLATVVDLEQLDQAVLGHAQLVGLPGHDRGRDDDTTEQLSQGQATNRYQVQPSAPARRVRRG
jgi:hypothetical protein